MAICRILSVLSSDVDLIPVKMLPGTNLGSLGRCEARWKEGDNGTHRLTILLSPTLLQISVLYLTKLYQAITPVRALVLNLLKLHQGFHSSLCHLPGVRLCYTFIIVGQSSFSKIHHKLDSSESVEVN